MKDKEPEEQAEELVLEFELDAAPEKVWRAVSVPAFREVWLPVGELADAKPVSTTPGDEIRYRMRESEPPFLESVVAFRLRPGDEGGTILTIVHRLEARSAQPPSRVANNNEAETLRAA